MSVHKYFDTTGIILKSIDLPKMGNNYPYTSPINCPCVSIFSATNTSCGNLECFLDPYLIIIQQVKWLKKYKNYRTDHESKLEQSQIIF
jgi:hypothetical protein